LSALFLFRFIRSLSTSETVKEKSLYFSSISHTVSAQLLQTVPLGRMLLIASS